MKKSTILIAVLAVIAATGVAKAEHKNISVNFDGRTLETGNFSEAIEAMPAPGTDEDPIPWIEPWFPGGQDAPLTPPMACMLYCQYGMKDDCSCIDPWWLYSWDMPSACQPTPHNGIWYEVAHCSLLVDQEHTISGAQGQTKSVSPARMLQPGLQQKLRKILLSYCDTYPEFAEVVLPMLKHKDTKITSHNKFIYIIYESRVIRFGGLANAKSATPTRKAGSGGGLGLLGAIAEAAGAVNDAINAWNDYSSWPPIPDNGMADEINGPQHGSHDGSHSTYHDNNGDSNYDVSRNRE